MLGIGEELKNKRLEKGLSIYDVENQTKINSSFIRAIENEEFDKIPGRVYLKGFIKNYAKFLDLDYMLYLEKLNQLFQENGLLQEDILLNSKPQLIRQARPQKPYKKFLQGLLILLLIAGLAFGTYKGYDFLKAEFLKADDKANQLAEEEKSNSVQDEKTDPVQENQEETANKDSQAEVLPAESEKSVAAEGKIKLEIIMSEGGPGKESCWIQVITDGKLAFEQTIMAGREPLIFTATESIDFTYGNAAAIQVKINGEDQGYLGESGKVDTKRIRAN